jgi:hypothetical protein
MTRIVANGVQGRIEDVTTLLLFDVTEGDHRSAYRCGYSQLAVAAPAGREETAEPLALTGSRNRTCDRS